MTEYRDRIVGLRRVKASDLKPHPLNPRIHPSYQRSAMRGVLEQIGYTDALVVREVDGGLELIDGHLRAETTPDQEVPVLVVDLNDAEAEYALATHDPLGAMARNDQDVLMELLGRVEAEDQGVKDMLEALANNSYESLVPMPEPRLEGEDDVAPAIDEGEPFTKRGQVWALGDHRLMCGEAPDDIEALLGGVEVDLVLTDPPYGIGIVKHGSVSSQGSMSGSVAKGKLRKDVAPNRQYMPVQGDDVPFDPTWLTETGANQIIFGGGYFADKLRPGATWLCWDKGLGEGWSFSGFELAWTSFTGHYRLYRHMWSGMVRAGPRAEEMTDRVHPTQKPVGLFAAILSDFTKDGAVVCDPYLGSGTTLIAAEKLGRRCYAMEIEPRYVDVAIRRWEAYTGRKAEQLVGGEG